MKKKTQDKQQQLKYKLTLKKSISGRNVRHIETLKNFKLRKIHQTVIVPKNDVSTGMVKSVSYLLDIEEIEA